MLDTLKNKNISATMVRHFLLMTLMFPLYTSNVSSAYSPDFVYANIFVAAFTVMAFLEGNIQWKKKSYTGYAVLGFLLCFNVCMLYVNKTYHNWFAGQINVTISFLFFLAWLFMKDSAGCMGKGMIRFLLGAAVIINLIALIPFLQGHASVSAFVNGYFFQPPKESDPYYTWIFLHKSEYSFVLVLFLALAVTYRHLFAKKWMFWGSLAVFGVCLMAANTRTTMLGTLFILAGVVLDHLVKKAGGFRWKYLLWLLPVAVVGIAMLLLFAKDRDVFSLGLRTYIWEGALNSILDNPWGNGSMCGLQYFFVQGADGSWMSTNAHSVFLNYFMQFSIPGGFFYLMMMVSIFAAAIWKNRSFTALGMLAAILVPMNMDWCVQLGQVPLMLMLLYFIFFHPLRNGAVTENE